MRSSPWMRGAPHVEFSTTMRKINSRISFGVGLLPTCLRTLEISRQYIQKPVRCQRTTVSGVTTMRDCCHPDQNRRTATQKSLSSTSNLGRGCRRFSTAIHCNGLPAVDFEKHRALTRMPRGLPLFLQHGFTVELKNLVSDAERRLRSFEMDSWLLRKTLATIACRMARLEGNTFDASDPSDPIPSDLATARVMRFHSTR